MELEEFAKHHGIELQGITVKSPAWADFGSIEGRTIEGFQDRASGALHMSGSFLTLDWQGSIHDHDRAYEPTVADFLEVALNASKEYYTYGTEVCDWAEDQGYEEPVFCDNCHEWVGPVADTYKEITSIAVRVHDFLTHAQWEEFCNEVEA